MFVFDLVAAKRARWDAMGSRDVIRFLLSVVIVCVVMQYWGQIDKQYGWMNAADSVI